jgi:ABC-type dipeptide/oligopeptide/nickel transport system permease component
MMILLIAALTVVIGNLIADLMYAVLDPRVRL